MITAADFRPPRWLRNPHLQSVLGSSALRRRRAPAPRFVSARQK